MTKKISHSGSCCCYSDFLVIMNCDRFDLILNLQLKKGDKVLKIHVWMYTRTDKWIRTVPLINCWPAMFPPAPLTAGVCIQPFCWFWDCSHDQGKAVLRGIQHWTGAETGTRDHSTSWILHSECFETAFLVLSFISLNSGSIKHWFLLISFLGFSSLPRQRNL